MKKKNRISKSYVKGREKMKSTEHKGYFISYNFYGRKEYTVQYCGDDIFFRSEKEAQEFINSIVRK